MNLPDLVEFNDYSGWDEYVEVIYEIYCKEIKTKDLTYHGNRIALRRYPIYQNKDKGFWHLITEGDIEDQRNPDLRRCAHIRWIKYVIANVDSGEIKVWKNTRKGKSNICLATGDFSYLVVLGERKDYVLLLSAYPTPESYKKRKLNREYEEYLSKNKIRPNGADSSSPSTHGR